MTATRESLEVRNDAIRRAYDQERVAFERDFPSICWEALPLDLQRLLVENALSGMGYEVVT